MIKGIKHWNNRDRYYTQTNNGTENILRKSGMQSYLETCGPTSAVMLADMMGYSISVKGPGLWTIQPEDYLAIYFNDPRNEAKLHAARKNIDPKDWMGNRVPQYYPAGMMDCFAIPAQFEWGASFEKVRDLILDGKGVMICFKTPGHYVAAVAYDDESQEIIYHDPWPHNHWPQKHSGKSGFMRTLSESNFENVQSFMVWIGE
jgi:hypothetical protein